MRAALLATLCAGLAASTADAKAPPVPLAIGGVEITGATSDALQVAVVTAVRTGLGAANPGRGPVGTCITPACLTAAAQAAKAQRVVAVSVAIVGELDYTITVVIADHEGRPVRRRVGDCPTCAVDEVTERVTALVGEAASAITDDSVAVEIATTPVAVALVVDGVDRGRAPWSGSMPAGPHHVVAGPVDHPFFLEASGAPQRIQVALPLAPSGRRRFGLITYGTAAAGGVALIVGVALIAKDGDPTCAHPSCPEIYDTATPAWLGVGVGVAALGAAGYMFWNDRRADRPVIAVVPTTGGAAAVATGRF